MSPPSQFGGSCQCLWFQGEADRLELGICLQKPAPHPTPGGGSAGGATSGSTRTSSAGGKGTHVCASHGVLVQGVKKKQKRSEEAGGCSDLVPWKTLLWFSRKCQGTLLGSGGDVMRRRLPLLQFHQPRGHRPKKPRLFHTGTGGTVPESAGMFSQPGCKAERGGFRSPAPPLWGDWSFTSSDGLQKLNDASER